MPKSKRRLEQMQCFWIVFGRRYKGHEGADEVGRPQKVLKPPASTHVMIFVPVLSSYQIAASADAE